MCTIRFQVEILPQMLSRDSHGRCGVLIEHPDSVVSKGSCGFSFENTLQLLSSFREFTQGFVNARDNEAQAPIVGVRRQMLSSVPKRRMISAGCDANTDEPVGRNVLVVAHGFGGNQVLLRAEKVTALSLIERDLKQFLRRKSGSPLCGRIWALEPGAAAHCEAENPYESKWSWSFIAKCRHAKLPVKRPAEAIGRMGEAGRDL
jgi:hypothetical protein